MLRVLDADYKTATGASTRLEGAATLPAPSRVLVNYDAATPRKLDRALQRGRRSPTASINRRSLDSGGRWTALRFEEHLAAPNGRGVVLSGGHDGHAGGSLCGDLIRVSVRVDGDRVVEAGFEAAGLRGADRRGLRGR